MKAIKYILTIAAAMVMTSCGGLKGFQSTSYTIELTSSASPTEHYNNLNRGLDLGVVSDVETNQIVDNSELDPLIRAGVDKQNVSFTPSIKTFVEETMSNYIRRMGIRLNSDLASDYKLRVTVTNFKLVRRNKETTATVVLRYTLSTNNNEVLFNNVARGRVISKSNAKTIINCTDVAPALSDAYEQALKDINWQAITDALTTHKRAEQEGQRQVKGDGDTALEHTVIRWYIDSSPKGADVSWRVVSSTPDVKNTNSTYVGTTPYETTESFDIRGLKYENSGNVQIEVTCERSGYLPQKRRFNLRQAIDQKEISAKFNLIKDE